MKERLEKLLLKVQKPARYAGGELNSVTKNLDDVAVRFAFCFPDLYEVGMSHLGMKILYGQFNNEPDVWCERVFAPDTDMEALFEIAVNNSQVRYILTDPDVRAFYEKLLEGQQQLSVDGQAVQAILLAEA